MLTSQHVPQQNDFICENPLVLIFLGEEGSCR